MDIKKKTKILIIALAVLFVILLALIIILKTFFVKPEIVDDLGNYEVEITEYSVDTENFDELLANLPIKSITMRDRIQNLAIDVLKEMYNDLKNSSDSEIEEYYNSNEATINSLFYNCDINNFKRIVKSILKMNEKEIKYTASEFKVDTLKIEDKTITFKMNITYNNEYTYHFIVHIDYSGNEILLQDIKFEFE